MAKTDLLKEAIADAKAVKETAIANAKIALEEAFGSRLESMLGAKLSEQLEDEDELDMGAEPGLEDDMGELDMEDDLEMGEPQAVRVGVDLNMDGSYDVEGELGADAGMEDDMAGELEAGLPDDMDAEPDMQLDAELEEIIKELEEGMYEEEYATEQVKDGAGDNGDGMIEEDIDGIIESILAEEDEIVTEGSYKMKKELEEAYSVINQLRYTINEVNLLNAKLLYTNKLFRNFELNESQKMKVIENFDRASNTREVKLVFSTLSESFKKPAATKRVVKESKSYASKPTASTAPKREIISESADFAARWQKLAGLIK